jgi:hypothetical protein
MKREYLLRRKASGELRRKYAQDNNARAESLIASHDEAEVCQGREICGWGTDEQVCKGNAGWYTKMVVCLFVHEGAKTLTSILALLFARPSRS